MAGAIWTPKDSEAALAHLTVLLPGVTAWAEREGLTRAEQPELDSGFQNGVTSLLTAQFPGEIIQRDEKWSNKEFRLLGTVIIGCPLMNPLSSERPQC
jgi:hypothetical protein